jgi:hypothetical protein
LETYSNSCAAARDERPVTRVTYNETTIRREVIEELGTLEDIPALPPQYVPRPGVLRLIVDDAINRTEFLQRCHQPAVEAALIIRRNGLTWHGDSTSEAVVYKSGLLCENLLHSPHKAAKSAYYRSTTWPRKDTRDYLRGVNIVSKWRLIGSANDPEMSPHLTSKCACLALRFNGVNVRPY